MAISIIVCFGALVVGLGIGVAVTAPDVAVVPLVLILAVCAVVMPVVVYPLSYTLWQAVDLAMHPPGRGDNVPPPVM
jgi:hypothetical protein